MLLLVPRLDAACRHTGGRYGVEAHRSVAYMTPVANHVQQLLPTQHRKTCAL
jgi:hypothetical protein